LLDSDGKIIKISILGKKNSSSNATSLAILGDKVYISGFENNIGTLWITDTSGSINQSVALSSSNYIANIFSNAAHVNNIYSTGYIVIGEIYKGTLWITNVNTLSTYATTFAIKGYTLPPKSIIALDDRLLIAGVNSASQDAATLWITNQAGVVIDEKFLGYPGFQSIASSITSIDNQVFCVGNQKIDAAFHATLWITDACGSSSLSIALSGLPSEANFVYTPIQSLALEKALLKFSNIHYQK